MVWKPRYTILGLIFGTYMVCYLDRMVMASAIPFIAQDLQLSPLAMGGVLSAFFLGYALMQLPGGMLSDRFGPNRVLSGAIVSWSIFTAATGMVTSLSSMLAVRVLFGLGEGAFPPAASKAIALWFPQREVGRANGLQLASTLIGGVIAPLFVVSLIATWGWRSVFYSLLVPGLLLAVLVRRYVRDVPPRDGSAEGPAQEAAMRIAVVQLLKMPAVLWCAVTLFFANIANWSLMNWLPTYLLQARGFSLTQMGVFSSLPFIAGAAGCYFGGHLFDTTFRDRKVLFILSGFLAAAALTFLAGGAPSGERAIVFLMGAFLCMFAAAAGIFTLPLVLVRREAVGAAFGIVNTAGQIAAFLSPLLIGYLLKATHGNFRLVFYCIVGFFCVAAVAATQIRSQSIAARA